jgi:hypothetical protein
MTTKEFHELLGELEESDPSPAIVAYWITTKQFSWGQLSVLLNHIEDRAYRLGKEAKVA